MTLTDELKILYGKIKGSQTQNNLNRQAAKIYALSSKVLDKYEYLTGNDLGYKPGVVKQTNFEYSQSGKVFNKGLVEKDKKRSTFKKVKKC